MKTDDYDNLLTMMELLQEMHISERPDIFARVQPAMSPDDFAETIQAVDYIALIAECKGQAAGFGFAKLKEPSMDPILVRHKTLYIDDIFVLQAFRRRHIGHALLQALETEGRMAGAERMDLNVWAFNENACNFYKAHGMKVQRILLEKPLL